MAKKKLEYYWQSGQFTDMFCGKRKGNKNYLFFFTNKRDVEFCHVDRLFKVRVAHTTEKKKKDVYYAWWDYSLNRYSSVHPTKVKVSLCFDRKLEALEKESIGKLHKVKITILEEL